MVRERPFKHLEGRNAFSERQLEFRKGKLAIFVIKLRVDWVKQRNRKKWSMKVVLNVKNTFNMSSWRIIIDC